MNSTNTQIDFLSFSPLNKSLQSLHYIALKHIRPFLLLFAFAISLSLSAQTKTYYVDAAKEDNSGDGTSWATAKKDLQVALDLADTGDEIRVAAGTYLPTAAPDDSTTDDRDKAFHLDKNVVLKGSYETASNTQDYNNPSILSGDFLADDVITGSGSTLSITMNTENAYHVFITVNLTAETIIDGFTFSGGNADGADNLTYSSKEFLRASGGGVYNQSSSPTVTNSSFTWNSAGFGGGVYNRSSSPTITNSSFSENSAATSGGGLYNNSSSPTITNSSFRRNSAGNGGAMFTTSSSSSPAIINSIFSGNTATDNGGGMYNSGSSPTITNSIFSGNSTAMNGGGIYNWVSSPTITNSSFIGNSATNNGGGLHNELSSSPTLYNTVFYGNTADMAGHDINGDAINESSSHNASDHMGGNINAGTGFVWLSGVDPFTDSTDPAGEDGIFRTADDGLIPHATSPLIDAGDNDRNDETTDIIGNVRIMGIAIDIGAYESQPSLSRDIPVVNISTIHPNPATDVLNIEVYRGVIEQVVIYNLSGEKLMSKKMQGSKKQQLDISKLPSGFYIISIHTDQGSSQQKLVVQ